MTERKKMNRGFANMDPARQREIASMGGKAAHQKGVGHQWDSKSAREAGVKGGAASRGGRGKLPATDVQPDTDGYPGTTPIEEDE